MYMEEILILRVVVRFIMPFIQVYGCYIIVSGHLGPGGGFAGGTIVAASMILYALTFNINKALDKVPHKHATILESLGAILLITCGIVGLLLGGNFLANGQIGIPLGTPGRLLSGGLVPIIYFGIGVKVAMTIMSLYFSLVEEDS